MFRSVFLMPTRLEVARATAMRESFSAGHAAAASSQRRSVPSSLLQTWGEACVLSRASAPDGKAVAKQTYNIVDKIREVDELLQRQPDLRGVIREIHPEVCFRELTGKPLTYRKTSVAGRDERLSALTPVFPQLQGIVAEGRSHGLAIEDILDAVVACWSALRLAGGKGRSLSDTVRLDSVGLPMAIWV